MTRALKTVNAPFNPDSLLALSDAELRSRLPLSARFLFNESLSDPETSARASALDECIRERWPNIRLHILMMPLSGIEHPSVLKVLFEIGDAKPPTTAKMRYGLFTVDYLLRSIKWDGPFVIEPIRDIVGLRELLSLWPNERAA